MEKRKGVDLGDERKMKLGFFLNDLLKGLILSGPRDLAIFRNIVSLCRCLRQYSWCQNETRERATTFLTPTVASLLSLCLSVSLSVRLFMWRGWLKGRDANADPYWSQLMVMIIVLLLNGYPAQSFSPSLHCYPLPLSLSLFSLLNSIDPRLTRIREVF